MNQGRQLWYDEDMGPVASVGLYIVMGSMVAFLAAIAMLAIVGGAWLINPELIPPQWVRSAVGGTAMFATCAFYLGHLIWHPAERIYRRRRSKQSPSESR